MNVTALVMSKSPYPRQWPGLTTVVLEGREFASSADHQQAWNDAIGLVQTEHFCFLDDDDDLPGDYLEVIAKCIAAGQPLAYTDELLRRPDGTESIARGEPYSQAAHLQNPMLVHHLAVCRTQAARDALKALPIGHYWPEMLLYWQLAKTGAAYVPRTGYIWNVAEQGLHTQPFAALAQMRSALWCKDHRN